MSNSKRMRSLGGSLESTSRSCGQVKVVLSLSRICDGTVTFRCRVLDEEVLIDRLSEDVSQIGPNLKHSVLGSGLCQIVQVDLQGELVEIPQRHLIERINQVFLDNQLFHLCSFFLPVCLFERVKAIPNKPPERHRAIVHHSAAIAGLAGPLGHFTFQCLSSFGLVQLRFRPENHCDPDTFLFFCAWVKNSPAKIPVPFFSTSGYVTSLIRLTHSFLNFCGGNNWACTHFIHVCDAWW